MSGAVTSMLGYQAGACWRDDYGTQRGTVWAPWALTKPSLHKLDALWGVSSRGGGGLQCWVDLRETRVYRFMSNTSGEVSRAKGGASMEEKGAPGAWTLSCRNGWGD